MTSLGGEGKAAVPRRQPAPRRHSSPGAIAPCLVAPSRGERGADLRLGFLEGPRPSANVRDASAHERMGRLPSPACSSSEEMNNA